MSDIRLTAAWVADAMRAAGGRLAAGDAAREFAGVSIDTRTLVANDLFVAIRGERFDGVEFVAAAIEKGAAGVVVPRSATGSSDRAWADRAAVIEADDTTAALQALANTIRRESGTRVVAITGSAGKTTTKEVTAELLSDRYSVIRNRGNFNNHIGLPLSLIDLRRRPEVAVVELGMNHAGEIRALVRIAEPDVRVWTNVGEAHLGFFDSLDAIADAKAEILERAGDSTLLVANADDERISARIGRFAGRVRTFGIEHDADVKASQVADRGVEGMSARVSTAAGTFDVESPLLGRANLQNVLAATAVAMEFGIQPAAIRERIRGLKPAPHRGAVLSVPGGATVIDDSYNANPTATRRALEVLAAAAAQRRIAVLGEMLELGSNSAALHEGIGRAAASMHVDVLVAVGGAAAKAMADAAVAAGMAPSNVRYFATSDDAAPNVAALVARGDLVLVKGSRGIRTERVVERLQADRG